MVKDVANIAFGPEVYVAKLREDADIYSALSRKFTQIYDDLAVVQKMPNKGQASVHLGDSRHLTSFVEKVEAVIKFTTLS
ncbi:MAG: hypothetical protein HC828_18805 [Blastochloris sp.]|nr:hypothetical protein [Blastochloris sp.]